MRHWRQVVPQVLSLALGAYISAGAIASESVCRSVSAPGTVALLELYSSEGCSSCPPADRFVSGLVDRRVGPERVIPIVLHVDYWDYIGWKDRFASPVFTKRQYWLSEKNTGKRSAYTPEIFVAGKEWREWGEDQLEAKVRAINARPAAQTIVLEVMDGATVKVNASLRTGGPPDLQLFVGLVQDGLASSIKAGENRGSTLRHDAVVRRWSGPFPGEAVVEFEKPREASFATGSSGLRVVAFAQNLRTGEIAQAISTALPCSAKETREK